LNRLRSWTDASGSPFNVRELASVKLERSHVRESVENCRDSSPGPDGVPYRAWKKLGDLGVDALYEAAVALQDPASLETLPEDFNQTFLCCLPKKASGVDSTLGEYHKPAGTRPPSLINTANRLIANAYRLLWEPVFDKAVSSMQRGFLKGRAIMRNAIDIDLESMIASLREDRAALILFDFEAAFPSISQEFLFESLLLLGMPQSFINVVRCLYFKNACLIKLKGQVFEGFEMTSGVRQGCPLSPLLFVLVTDVLLRRLQTSFPRCVPRAFADDNAMVVSNLWQEAPGILSVYREFEGMSNLKLNLAKTVIIPLWPCDVNSVKRTIRNDMPQWASAAVELCGPYIGFQVGPRRVGTEWTKALVKYSDRAKVWSSLHLGMQYNARVYNTFVCTVLAYLWQVCELPSRILAAEGKALAMFTPGPGSWRKAVDLYNLTDLICFPVAFQSIRDAAWASRLRLAATVVPDLHALCDRFRNALRDTRHPHRRAEWKEWYESSFVSVLQRAVEQARVLDICPFTLHAEAAKPRANRPGEQASLQSRLYRLLLTHPVRGLNFEDRFHKKLARWKLPSPLGTLARRARKRAQWLSKLVAPRVLATIFRTWWNGWCTARRFQKIGKCVFGCSPRADDSIEHYMWCPFTTQMASRLGISVGRYGPEFFLCLARGMTEREVTTMSVIVYSVFRASSLYRELLAPSADRVHDALENYCKIAVQNHRSSSQIGWS